MKRQKKKPRPEPEGICVVCKEWHTLKQRRSEYSQVQRFCPESNAWMTETDRCIKWKLTSYLYCSNQKSKFFRPAFSCGLMPNGKPVCGGCEIGRIVRRYILREVVFRMSGKELILNAAQELSSTNLLASEKSDTLRRLLERGNISEVGDYYMGLVESIPLKQERSIPKEALRVYNALIDGTITFETAETTMFDHKISFIRTK